METDIVSSILIVLLSSLEILMLAKITLFDIKLQLDRLLCYMTDILR